MNTETQAILGRGEGGHEMPPRSQNTQRATPRGRGDSGEQLGIPYAQKFHSYICTLGDMHRKVHGSAVYSKKFDTI